MLRAKIPRRNVNQRGEKMKKRAWATAGLVLLLAGRAMPGAAVDPTAVPENGSRAEEAGREVGGDPGTAVREEARKAGQEMEAAGKEVEKGVHKGAETVEHEVRDGAQDFGTGITD
jgi:hypothetical protein